jgi:hypothetical protein
VSTTSGQFLRNCAASLLLVIGILSPADALNAAPPVQAWVQRYPGAQGTKIAVDPDGNVVVAGNIGSYGPGVVIKYSSSGVGLWTNFWRGPWTSSVEDMAVGTNGNIYVTGYASEMKSSPDYQTIAYSRDGMSLWTNYYKGIYTNIGNYPPYTSSADDRATGVATDGSGKVYVTGSSKITTDRSEYVTIAYSNLGTPLWTNRYPAYWTRSPAAVVADTLGHVYVAGTSPVGEGAPAFATLAYSNEGVPLWFNNGGTPWGSAQALAVDGSGNVCVAGSYMQAVIYSSGGTRLWWKAGVWYPATASAVAVGSNTNVYLIGCESNSVSGYDFVTLAYSSAAPPLWTNRYDGPGHTNDYAQALAVGRDGTVYVTGYSWGTDSFYDYLTIAYSSDGVPLWTNRYNGPANGYDQAFAMAVDGSGNIYVTGYSQGDCTTIKYAPAPSLRFSAIDLMPGPACRLTITGASNLVFRLEASTHLADWQTLTNYFNLPFSSIQYTDPLAPGYPERFYRTVWTP